jgi:hypothetical protein
MLFSSNNTVNDGRVPTMATKNSTATSSASPIDAIWNTDQCTADEKLVIYYLTTRHQIGEKYSPTYLTVDKFIDNLGEQWSNFKEIEEATRLSKVRLERALAQLETRKIVKTTQRPARVSKKNQDTDLMPRESVYDITEKLFTDYMGSPAATRNIA